MSARAALILGFFLVVAALAHGGIYSAGHDFVVNRFTGSHEFVPSEEPEEASDAIAAGRARPLRLDVLGTRR
jgi:hypothetical protein